MVFSEKLVKKGNFQMKFHPARSLPRPKKNYHPDPDPIRQ